MSDVLSALIERLVKLEAEVARLKAQELNLPAGAASAPAVTLAGDTNTGLWQSAADNLDFATGGMNRLNVSSAGLAVGTDDTALGLLRLFGNGASNPEGGEIQLFMSANHDSPYDFWFIDIYADDLRFGPQGQTYMTLTAEGNAQVSGGCVHVTGSGTPTSGVGLEIEYDGTQGDIMAYDRDTPGYKPLRLRASNFYFLVGATKALEIEADGDAWFVGDVSAATFTDHTPYPDRDTALAAVKSMRQDDKGAGLDHKALHPYVASKGGDEGRDLSATVSAQNVVIQELLERIASLESQRQA